jgi:hypothetical protein
MKSLVVGVLIIFTASALISHGYVAKQAESDLAFDQPSEISFERIHDGCIDCPDRKVVLRRKGARKFEDAAVTRIDLLTKKQVQGKLRAYYYNNLLKLIEFQGYFGMKDAYAMGWEDSTIVNLSVTVGDKRKVIRTRSEGHVPIQLWGIYYAIDGAVANTNWGK